MVEMLAWRNVRLKFGHTQDTADGTCVDAKDHAAKTCLGLSTRFANMGDEAITETASA